MRVKTVLFILTLTSFFITKAQSGDELEKRKGFKEIILGSQIDNYTDLEYFKDFKNKNIPGTKIYSRKKGTYEDIAGIKIQELQVKVYRGTIYEIDVLTEKDPRLAESLKKAFGNPIFSVRSNTYNWSSKSVGLSMTSKGKSKFELIYRWKDIRNLVKKDRQDEIQDISQDF